MQMSLSVGGRSTPGKRHEWRAMAEPLRPLPTSVCGWQPKEPTNARETIRTRQQDGQGATAGESESTDRVLPDDGQPRRSADQAMPGAGAEGRPDGLAAVPGTAVAAM